MYAVFVGTVNEVLEPTLDEAMTCVSVTLAGLLPQRFVPFSEMQPLVRLMPLPKVLVAEVPVRFR